MPQVQRGPAREVVREVVPKKLEGQVRTLERRRADLKAELKLIGDFKALKERLDEVRAEIAVTQRAIDEERASFLEEKAAEDRRIGALAYELKKDRAAFQDRVRAFESASFNQQAEIKECLDRAEKELSEAHVEAEKAKADAERAIYLNRVAEQKKKALDERQARMDDEQALLVEQQLKARADAANNERASKELNAQFDSLSKAAKVVRDGELENERKARDLASREERLRPRENALDAREATLVRREVEADRRVAEAEEKARVAIADAERAKGELNSQEKRFKKRQDEQDKREKHLIKLKAETDDKIDQLERIRKSMTRSMRDAPGA